MSAVMELRSAHKEEFERQHGVGLGFMSFFVRAACEALQRFPRVNAYLLSAAPSPAGRGQGEGGGAEIEFHDFCDISIAVGTERGLVVPVLRNAESMSFAEIEAAIKDFGARAREGKMTLEEMTGGTFTISNGGVYGSLNSTPILNPPQSAILGMHAIRKRPVEYPAASGQIALRPMMYLALSYDHRMVDGAEAVSFLVHIRNCIESPQRMMLGV
jgi:2-oxoglutarate dehydrogenase E2 component (dihydrolipoamide succinyltransferase)